MIKFNLKCAQGHGFDSWFGSNDDFEKLKTRGMISCVVCGDCDVSKAVMTPRVAQEQKKPDLRKPPEIDDVGKGFPDEARRIHYGEAPARPIMGQAKLAEAKDLIDEGVPVVPIGWKPDQVN